MKFDGTHQKKVCPNCGKDIQAANFNRHYNACINGYKNQPKRSQEIIQTETLCCPFCDKQAKNENSYAQHYVRCRKNDNAVDREKLSNYIAANRKGKNKDNCDDIAKQVETVLTKYADGYISPKKGSKNLNYENNIYKEQNEIEIKAQFDYIRDIDINYEYTITKSDRYNILTHAQKRVDNTVIITFEHDYIANQLLANKLSKDNTVHHIDKNGHNNSKYNLLVFETEDDHKRFHNSKYAKLTYHSDTHLFSCFIDKERK